MELLPSGPDGGVLVGGVLQLDDPQRQAVEEQDDIGAAVVPVFGDGELVDRQPVVVVRVAPVHHPSLVAPDGAVVVPVLHRHPVDQHPVKRAVASLQGRAFGVGQLAEGTFHRCEGQVRVEPGQGVPQPTFQHHLTVVVPLRAGCVRRNVRAVGHLPAEGRKPVKGDLLHVGLGEAGHDSPDSIKYRFRGLRSS